MQNTVAIENIEEMRRQNGIDDAELREQVRRLRVGDSVRLTFLADTLSASGETLPVRITRIQGHAFRGKLSAQPASAGLATLQMGAPVVFNRAHIHSVPRK